MVAPELYATAQPPESAISPAGQVATTGPTLVPDSVAWLTTWWTEGPNVRQQPVTTPEVGVGVAAPCAGVGVGWIPPPPEEPPPGVGVLPPEDAPLPPPPAVTVCAPS